MHVEFARCRSPVPIRDTIVLLRHSAFKAFPAIYSLLKIVRMDTYYRSLAIRYVVRNRRD